MEDMNSPPHSRRRVELSEDSHMHMSSSPQHAQDVLMIPSSSTSRAGAATKHRTLAMEDMNSPTHSHRRVELSEDSHMHMSSSPQHAQDVLMIPSSSTSRAGAELILETLRGIQEVKSLVLGLREDMDKIKMAIMSSPTEVNVEQYVQQYETVEDFEGYTLKLEDGNERKQLSKYLHCKYGQRNIGEAVRNILKATMTDNLQIKYNRSGKVKRKLPDLFEKCIYSAIKPFHKVEEIEVKRGNGHIVTTVRNEVGKQIEVYLANAQTRITRSNKKN